MSLRYLFGILFFEILVEIFGETFAPNGLRATPLSKYGRKFGIFNFNSKVVTMVLNQKLLVSRVLCSFMKKFEFGPKITELWAKTHIIAKFEVYW